MKIEYYPLYKKTHLIKKRKKKRNLPYPFISFVKPSVTNLRAMELLALANSNENLCDIDLLTKWYELKRFGLFYCVDDGDVVYCSRYIILLYYLYYFIVLNAKIKLLMLGVL